MNRALLIASALTVPSMAATDFDFYVYSTSWQPSFCYGHYGDYPGCSTPDDFWEENLTIHGAWPQYTNGSWPADCTSEGFDDSVVQKVGESVMKKYWPNVKEAETSSSYTEFWEHEWTKHGTCSGLDQAAYFQATIDNFPSTPSIVGKAVGSSLSKSDLIAAYGTTVVPQCSSGYLSDIIVCMSKEFKAMDCPDSVISEGSCGDTIKVDGFEQ